MRKARLRREILQKEVDLLCARIGIVKPQAGTVAKSCGNWVNASARSQLAADRKFGIEVVVANLVKTNMVAPPVVLSCFLESIGSLRDFSGTTQGYEH
jgi:hypothetical protein